MPARFPRVCLRGPDHTGGSVQGTQAKKRRNAPTLSQGWLRSTRAHEHAARATPRRDQCANRGV
eukprot:15340769-Alexandrium_andersonii.AAC.1